MNENNRTDVLEFVPEPAVPHITLPSYVALAGDNGRLRARVDELLRETNRLMEEARAARAERDKARTQAEAVVGYTLELTTRLKALRTAADEAPAAAAPEAEATTPGWDGGPPPYAEVVDMLDAYAATDNPPRELCDRITRALALMTTDRDGVRGAGEEEAARLRGIIERDRCTVARALAAARAAITARAWVRDSRVEGPSSARQVRDGFASALTDIEQALDGLTVVAVSMEGTPADVDAMLAAREGLPVPEVAYVGHAGPRDVFVHMHTLEAMAAGLAAAVREAQRLRIAAEEAAPGEDVDVPEWVRRVNLGAWAAAKSGVYERTTSGRPIRMALAIEFLIAGAEQAASILSAVDGHGADAVRRTLSEATHALKRYGIPGMTTAPEGADGPKKPRAHTAAYAEADVVIDLGGRIVKEMGEWQNGSTIRVLDERHFCGRHLPAVTVVTDPADPTPSLDAEDKGVLLTLVASLPSDGRVVVPGAVAKTHVFRERYLRDALGSRLREPGGEADKAAVEATFRRCYTKLLKAGLVSNVGEHVSLTDLGVAVAERLVWENANAGS